MSKQTYNGNLNIDKTTVSIETDYIYQGIEINYVGQINITSLLPSQYLVSKGSNKIIIIKLEKSTNNLTDLFTYKGKALITKCKVITKELKSYNLYINKLSLELYNTLKGKWEDNTRNWQDLSFDGNNKKYNYQYKKTSYDKENKSYTTIKEIRNK
ncbi:MAG: hypothetical protein Tp1122DCM00d2C27307611_5 [Prokaryotic dsDNA virus sp.]|nr:MAG: hypothetical protein Tp1122DCM00d2C27307611_5 [Prokaryotic dsDNA virus sp.]|tara:strand:- start:10209 stop:10676 length:468 start_codon:yes stop_codon:yes gene_type:complete